jgi:hypothetical protein
LPAPLTGPGHESSRGLSSRSAPARYAQEGSCPFDAPHERVLPYRGQGIAYDSGVPPEVKFLSDGTPCPETEARMPSPGAPPETGG